MKFKELKEKRWFKILSNKYVFILICFGIWMIIFDSNSWLVQHELNGEINNLKNNKTYYKKEISKDSTLMKQLENPEGIERYAREKYYMKRPNEDVYIIKFKDSLKEK